MQEAQLEYHVRTLRTNLNRNDPIKTGRTMSGRNKTKEIIHNLTSSKLKEFISAVMTYEQTDELVVFASVDYQHKP